MRSTYCTLTDKSLAAMQDTGLTYSTMYTGGAWDGTTTPLISIIVSSD